MGRNLSDYSRILERLDLLENEKRSVKRLAVGSLLVALSLFASGFMSPSTTMPAERSLRAEKLVLVNSLDQEIAVLECENGEPTFAMTSPNGRGRVKLGMSSGSPALSLYGSRPNARATLQVQQDGAPNLTLQDINGKPLAILMLMGGTRPFLSLGSPSSNSSLTFSFSDAGSQMISLKDANGRSRLGIGVSQTGEPSIEVLEKDGSSVSWKAPP
jgi:hypothetical protein